MKIIKKIKFVLFATLIASCSSDDNANTSTTLEEGVFTTDVTEISVANHLGNVPSKGDEITISVTVVNLSSSNGTVAISPKITSRRFDDFSNVSLPLTQVAMNAGETKVVRVMAGPFIEDTNTAKRYALNSGDYEVETVTLDDFSDSEFEGGTFNIETSNTILVPVLYDPAYLEALLYSEDIQSYMKLAFTRTVEVFNDGNTSVFNGGIDEMMNVEHLFYPISTINISDYPEDGDLCSKSAALAADELGLSQSWSGSVARTEESNHGFDYLISLTPDAIGGSFCESRGSQVSGTTESDLSVNRAQLTMAHQSGHIFGAQHCDASLDFVMCGGVRNSRYIEEGIYVFDAASRSMMENKFE